MHSSVPVSCCQQITEKEITDHRKEKKKKRRKHGNLKGRRQGASCGALECTRGGVLSECGRVARCSYVLSAGPRVFSLKFVPVVR